MSATTDPFAPLDNATVRPRTKADRDELAHVPVVPKDAPQRPDEHPALGPPMRKWTYRDANGEVCCHLWRFLLADGRKDYRPLTLWRDAKGAFAWRFLAPPAPRMLYGLDELAKRPKATVLLVEGEKTADRAADIFKSFVAVTSMGGAAGAKHADWSPLEGRDVIIWPDAGKAGAAYARDAATALAGVAAAVRIVILGDNYPDGWDLADVNDPARPQPRFIGDSFLARAIAEAAVYRPPSVVPPALAQQDAAPPSTDADDGISGAALQTKVFAPIQWIVPEFIVEGLTLVAGKPKLGKSWVALNLGVAVASGGRAFSTADCEPGDVLALCLEDNQRRLQTRMRQLMGERPWPERLRFQTAWPRLDDGGLDRMAAWIAKAEKPRLILVDVWTKVRGKPDGKKSLYADDFESLSALQMLAGKHRIAVVAIHHTSKRENPEDPFDLVSGTTGLTGAADSILILRKETGQADAMLYGRGRDLHVFEKAMAFEKERGLWSVLGDAEVFRCSELEAKILKVLDAEEGLRPKEVGDLIGEKPGSVKATLHRMAKTGRVKNTGGKYVR